MPHSSPPHAEHWLERAWRRRGLPALLLLPFAAPFAAARGIRRAAYRAGLLRRERLPVPVVVVGNLSVGATGKTPLVIHLAKALSARGVRVGIVSRGYAAVPGAPRLVAEDDDAATVGDEPLLIRRRSACPVAVHPDRAAAARLLLERHPETELILSDDGLQHLRLERDLEIAVVPDGSFGNGWPLPAGPLREPPRRLSEVDAVVGGDEAVLLASTFKRPVFRMARQLGNAYRLDDPTQVTSLEGLSGMILHAVAGIGRPERFFGQLAALGLDVETHAFPDHHAYRASDLAFADGAILTTEKDAVKFRGLAPALPVWVLPLEITIEPDLAAFVLEKLNGFAPA